MAGGVVLGKRGGAGDKGLKAHPHHGRWLMLHGLCLDGVRFAGSRGRQQVITASTCLPLLEFTRSSTYTRTGGCRPGGRQRVMCLLQVAAGVGVAGWRGRNQRSERKRRRKRKTSGSTARNRPSRAVEVEAEAAAGAVVHRHAHAATNLHPTLRLRLRQRQRQGQKPAAADAGCMSARSVQLG